MMSKNNFLKGTLILTCAGFLNRLIGFFYRIFLSHTIGAEGMGLFQLTMPLQMMVMAIAASGIQTAVSRLYASQAALGNHKKAREYFCLGTSLAISLAALLSFLLYQNASFFAQEILKESRTEPFIRLLSFCFPLSALHSCASSYYYAQKKTEIPSCFQFLEQVIRVSGCYLLSLIFLAENRPLTPVIAIGGTLISEIAVSFLYLFALGWDFKRVRHRLFPISHAASAVKDILHMSVPLSLNRMLVTLLSSIEVILIPQMLLRSGLTSKEALSIYGIFTGMALPLILFPSTITNSVSVMLMPSVAQLQALGNQKQIQRVASRTLEICLALGGVCTLIFFVFGKAMGQFLFHSPTAGIYIQTLAFICPFLYLNTTLSSILNGLGKPGTCLIHSVAGIGIRLCFVTGAIPVMGIRGYLYGLLLSEMLISLLHMTAVRRSN